MNADTKRIASKTTIRPNCPSRVETKTMVIQDRQKSLAPGDYIAVKIPNYNSGHTDYRLSGLVMSDGRPCSLFLLDEVNFERWKARIPSGAGIDMEINMSIPAHVGIRNSCSA